MIRSKTMPLEVMLNRRKVDNPYNLIKPKDILEASTPPDVFSKHGGFYLFQTNLREYKRDLDYFLDNDGGIVNLGDMPTLTHGNARNVSLVTEPETLYDILFIHRSSSMYLARFSTGSYVPERLTVDQIKLMIIRRSNLTLDDVQGVDVSVVFGRPGSSETMYEPISGFKIGDAIVGISRKHLYVLHHIGSTPEEIAAQIKRLKG